MEERAEIHPSPLKATVATLAAVTFALLGGYLGFVADLDDSRSQVLRYIATPLFSLLAVVGALNVLRPRPVLVLTPDGVQLAHPGVFLPWSEVYDVEVVRKPVPGAWRSFDVLVFRAHDRGRIRLLKPWSSALLAWHERSWLGEPFAINTASLGDPRIIEKIERYRGAAEAPRDPVPTASTPEV